jgi:SulP family sulfate permease
MDDKARHRAQPGFADLFTPKLVTVLRDGYGGPQLRADVFAGLTVAIVALPLSMAIAIASGATPAAGLYTAIIGGFLVSLLGGSRFQIGGPAGAFIVLVAAIIDRHGFDGLLLATLMGGLILMVIGFLRLGTYIKYIPHPVIVGFTAAIAIIIFASQLRDLFGITLAAKEPAALLPKLQALWAASGTINLAAFVLSLGVIGVIVTLRRVAPKWPNLLIAVAGATVLTAAFGLPVETVGSRFGAVPGGLPWPTLPALTIEKIITVLPDAAAIALLAGIESLLSAVVADGMSGRRHRANCELVAQGVANIGSSLFGGVPVTGTIARTATNIRSGAVGPVSGMLHAVFLLAGLMLAAPMMAHIPLAALAGVLAVVAWNMAEKHEVAAILRHGGGDALVLTATFLLTIFVDLMVGIGVGVVLGSLVFMHRMAELASVDAEGVDLGQDRADDDAPRQAFTAAGDVITYRLHGPLFFGAASTIAAVLERIGRYPKRLIVDLTDVPFLDSTAAVALAGFVTKAERNGVIVDIIGTRAGTARALAEAGVLVPPATTQPLGETGKQG